MLNLTPSLTSTFSISDLLKLISSNNCSPLLAFNSAFLIGPNSLNVSAVINTKTRISQIYRKLDPNKPAYTVTASGGGGTFMYHWTDRELTNRERARLQTFPDDYEFIGTYSSVRKQIGMAVPCKLSNIVITAILNSFAGIKYPWVKPNLEE